MVSHDLLLSRVSDQIAFDQWESKSVSISERAMDHCCQALVSKLEALEPHHFYLTDYIRALNKYFNVLFSFTRCVLLHWGASVLLYQVRFAALGCQCSSTPWHHTTPHHTSWPTCTTPADPHAPHQLTHMTWHDMTWHDMTWHDMTWHDMTWHDMTWHDMTWHDMTWHDMTWHDMTWYDGTPRDMT